MIIRPLHDVLVPYKRASQIQKMPSHLYGLKACLSIKGGITAALLKIENRSLDPADLLFMLIMGSFGIGTEPQGQCNHKIISFRALQF